MADSTATPPVDAPPPSEVPPALTSADPAPAPSDAPPPADAKTLTTDDSKPADPPADPPKPDDKAPEAKAAVVVPEKYEFKLPEGVKLDEGFLDAMTPAFKEAGLSQEQASKLVDGYVKVGQKLETQREADFQKWMSDQARDNDKAIRNEWGQEYDANFKTAQRGLARFFQDKDFYAVLDSTGIVRNPAFMRGLLQIGKMIREDVPPGGAQPNGRKSNAEVFYGAAQ